MNIFQLRSKIIVTCSNRIAPYLQKEINTLGYSENRLFKTGIEMSGTMNDCIRLNLNLTCASQVLFSLKTFRAYNAEELYQELKKMPWENIIPSDGYFSISSNVTNPNITNNLFANVKVKDAIADRFRDLTGSRPDSGSMLDKAVVHLYWKEDFVEVFIDTSGETLSKHGYRKIPGKAPMLESLAAANLLALQWNGETPFINPMCGSGTMAIEAALKATGRTPGLLRQNYAFMHLVGFDRQEYDKCYQELLSKINDDINVTIVASDISEDAVNISKINAGIAGVTDLIRFECCDFEQTLIPENGAGVVFFNPEYGDRLGEEIALQPTYARIGDFMKKQCKGYMGYVFTGNLELAKKIGLKPKRRIEFYNGKIDCRLFEYELYAGSREQKNVSEV